MNSGILVEVDLDLIQTDFSMLIFFCSNILLQLMDRLFFLRLDFSLRALVLTNFLPLLLFSFLVYLFNKFPEHFCKYWVLQSHYYETLPFLELFSYPWPYHFPFSPAGQSCHLLQRLKCQMHFPSFLFKYWSIRQILIKVINRTVSYYFWERFSSLM